MKKTSLKELMTKIKWDKRENPDDYVIGFRDLASIREIQYNDIKRFEGSFMIIAGEHSDVSEIPMHRINYVKKNGVIVWTR